MKAVNMNSTMIRPSVKNSRCVTWSAAILILCAIGSAQAASTLLNFDDLMVGTTVTTQYGARGVLFYQAYLDADPGARSPTKVLRRIPPGGEVFTPAPLVMTFTSPQRRVKLFAESEFAAANGTLKVFGANGALLAQDGPRLVAADVFATLFEITLATASITTVEMHIQDSPRVSIDDLEYEGEPPAPPPTVAPVVQITSPANGAELDASTLDIAGTVTGEGLLSLANLTMMFRLPPESTAPTFTSALDVIGNGTSRTFSLPGFTGLPLGPITITVSTENFGGLVGTGTSTVTNLPEAIRDRFAAEGGTAVLGAFRFGGGGDGCKIAIYENGAISADAAGVSRLFRGLILTKWLTLRGGIGCPLGEERNSPAGLRAQDFQGGRIHIIESNGSLTTAFVPAVFVDAIDKRGGEGATGVPLGDALSPVEPFAQTTRTWLYQQFERMDRPDLLPSTLEIRGTPPVLSMARQSGDLSVDTTGTIWEEFPCSGNLGPCDVETAQTVFPPIQDAGNRFCGGISLDEDRVGVLLDAGRGEWEPIKGDHYTGTPIFGVITDSALAGEDFAFSHEWSYNCPFETLRLDCPSDWTLHVTPVGPHRDIGDFPSLFAAGNPDSVEIEYERFYGDFAVWMGRPAVGDLFFAVGRWIIDCGHPTFKSELHPIYMSAKMKTVTSLTDPFTGLVNNNPFGGQPATQADIWVNGWYPGGTPIEVDLFPPPRPTPTARLVVNKPVDADAAFGVDIEYSLAPQNAATHVHVTFSAPRRENHVNVWGQVSWEVNRGYEGQWFVYWAP